MLGSPRPTVSELVFFHLHLHQSSSSGNFHYSTHCIQLLCPGATHACTRDL